MGQPWIKTEDGWQPTQVFVRQAAGWAKARFGFRKTGATTWTQFYQQDTTPPAVPVIKAYTVPLNDTDIGGDAHVGKLTISLVAPSDPDIKLLRVKIGPKVSLNNTTDANYVQGVDGNDAHWSDWNVTPGQTRTKTYPQQGYLTNGQTYVLTVWAMDKSNNFSAPVTATVTYKVRHVPVLKIFEADITPTDSVTWNLTGKKYYTADAHLRTGGPENYRGYFYYSTRLSALLKDAKEIAQIRIRIQRWTKWDFTGRSEFRLFAHSMTDQLKTDPTPRNLQVDADRWIRLGHGDTVDLVVPGAWYPDILSGKIKGIGLFSTQSSGKTDDKYNGTYYSKNANGGRLHVIYKKLV